MAVSAEAFGSLHELSKASITIVKALAAPVSCHDLPNTQLVFR